MRIAILQPSYLPWLGFFEQMARTDHFVYLNDVQYTKQDWRNRNRIKTEKGAVWLTVPVRKAPHATPINRIEICYRGAWPEEHLRTVELAYKRAPHFQPFFSRLEALLSRRFALLQELSHAVADLCRSFLDVSGPISWASDLNSKTMDKNGRLIELCKAHGADLLYDGKAARAFIDVELFRANGVDVVFQDYQHPVYPQLWGEFVSHLSAIDLIMNTGPEAPEILRQSSVPPQLCDATALEAAASAVWSLAHE